MPTPNVIKYSVSNVSNTIGRNNMRLGISDSASYGPTSSTDFWNGYTPGASGYTIYVNKVSNGPSIFSPANDTELINTAKYIATSINLSPTITTAVEAIAWINSQSDMICVNYNYPSIVTSGLVALLDASFTTSYSKGGTGWRDLSDTQSTATLINGVSYLTNNNGSLSYSSSSLQYVELPDLGNLNNFTVSCWFKLNTLPTTSGAAAVVTNVYNGSNLNFSVGLNNSPFSSNICGGFFNGAWRTTSGFTPATGSWYSVDVTYNGSQIIQYLNGAQQSTLTYSGTAQSSGLGIRIGRRWDSSPSSVDFINGEIPFVSIYNRALTSTEILSNYNAISPRYSVASPIVTDSLFMELDASNYTSGTWTDETGNGNNATINGATWLSTDGGIFDLDGVNDTISIPHNSSLSLSTTQQRTIQVWVKFDTTPSLNTQGQPVFGKLSSSSGFDGYWGGLYSTGAQTRVVTNGTSTQKTTDSVSTVTTGVWYLYTFISQITSTANTTKVYINETEYSSTSHGSDTYSETNPLYLGYIGAGVSSPYLNGKIGACYFYTKGLSSVEISQNFNATKSKYGL